MGDSGQDLDEAPAIHVMLSSVRAARILGSPYQIEIQ